MSNYPILPCFGLSNQSLYAMPINFANFKANRQLGILASHNGMRPDQKPVMINLSARRFPNGKKAK